MNSIPVIYMHFGPVPAYMVVSIEQAAINNNVIVLTDTGFTHSKVKSYPIAEYSSNLELFDSVYRHMSTNSEEFEKVCIKRWFVLRDFVLKQAINVCYYTDSDVMIYDSVGEVYENYKPYDACYTQSEFQDNYRWAASACCSYWTSGALDKFCNYTIDLYKRKGSELDEKWEYHRKNNIAGGICDMTLLYLFAKTVNFCSLSKVKGGVAFDGNVMVADNYSKDEYRTQEGGMKSITWKNAQPYGFNKVSKEEVRFIALTEYAKVVVAGQGVFAKAMNKMKALIGK